jgi:hypothetical protein
MVLGVCKICNDGAEVRLVSRAKSLCLHHYKQDQYAKAREKQNLKRLNKGYAGINAVSDKQKDLNKADDKFYREIWRERPHVSELSGEELGDKMERFFMSHVLCKKLYPHFRHLKKNIVLMTKHEHVIYEFSVPVGPKWEKVKKLKEELLQEYNELERAGEWK